MATPDIPSVHPLISKRQDLLNNVEGSKNQLSQHELKIKEAVYQAVQVVLGVLVGSQGYSDPVIDYGNTLEWRLRDSGFTDVSIEMTWWKKPENATDQYKSFIQALENAADSRDLGKELNFDSLPNIAIKITTADKKGQYAYPHNIHVLVKGKVSDLLGLLPLDKSVEG